MELRRSNNIEQPRPAHTPAPRPAGPVKRGKLETALIIILIIAAITLITYLGVRLFAGSFTKSQVNSNQYQAVFLANGQVYFGKLQNVQGDYLRLINIYYLQVQQSVQPDAAKPNQDGQQPQVSLAKLGSELHGPEDAMYISRDQVLFWENLKGDGKVSQAIKNNAK